MPKTDGGILAPRGFAAGAIAAGIKGADEERRLDVAVVWSRKPAVSAAVFTQNSVIAAPVRLSKIHCVGQGVQAIAVNSGNANCMTGEQGERDALQMAQTAAAALKIAPEQILVASTGIIGKPLPADRVTSGITAAVKQESPSGGEDFAEAIMTTDTHPKSVAYSCEIGGKTVTVGGCAKGSGMIQPNMATMLGFITSDAAITPELLDKALRLACRDTFNAITVDGCSSTNDTVALLANGQAGNPLIDSQEEAYISFLEVLTQVCHDLALMVVRDGEGATILVTVRVKGAEDYDQAKSIAYAVANSPLVKTAAHGKTGNWGRIAQAVGTLGLPITEHNLGIQADSPAEDELVITVTTDLGPAEATVYTCDLSKDYIDINVEYN
jgi:glutamate N-acetyltransferase / amino-acid N-acetyltransferase